MTSKLGVTPRVAVLEKSRLAIFNSGRGGSTICPTQACTIPDPESFPKRKPQAPRRKRGYSIFLPPMTVHRYHGSHAREQHTNEEGAPLFSSQQRLHDVLDVEVADVEVGLPGAHEDDGLARGVHERERRADLVADRVELRQHDAVDDAPRLGRGELEERLVEAGDLVDGLVAHERLAHEEDEVGVVEVDQLGERTHQRLVVLHAPRRVDEHAVVAHLLRVRDAVGRDPRRVAAVALLVERQLERLRVHAQLLHCAGAEGVARAEHRYEAVALEVVGHFGEARRLAHAIDADEDDHVRPLLVARALHVGEQVDTPCWRQDARERALHRRLDRGRERGEAADLLAQQAAADRLAHLLADVLGDVLRDEPVEQLVDDRLQLLLLQWPPAWCRRPRNRRLRPGGPAALQAAIGPWAAERLGSSCRVRSAARSPESPPQ
eukprot:scaffold50131_cov60-Phaeocystis_antarctica.AAC.1